MSTNPNSRWLCEQWAAHIGPAVRAMTGREATAHLLADGAEPPNSDSLLIWRQPFDAVPGAELWVAVSAELWEHVGRMVLSSAGLAEDDQTEIRGTFVEVLQQSLSPLCAALSSRLRREVPTHPGASMAELPLSGDWHSIEVRLAGHTAGMTWAQCNPLLAQALAVPAEPANVRCERSGGRGDSRTLDLLMEVELPVSVSFGRAQMRLKDAIKLSTGSIVELNRSVAEPVEIVVNNCVIARGEVVVVDGNYGVRIRHIVSLEERLRTLF